MSGTNFIFVLNSIFLTIFIYLYIIYFTFTFFPFFYILISLLSFSHTHTSKWDVRKSLSYLRIYDGPPCELWLARRGVAKMNIVHNSLRPYGINKRVSFLFLFNNWAARHQKVSKCGEWCNCHLWDILMFHMPALRPISFGSIHDRVLPQMD